MDIEITSTNLVRTAQELQNNKDVNRCVFEHDNIWRSLLALEIPESQAMF